MINQNLLNHALNPKNFILKKWFADILYGRVVQHEDIIERISHALATNKDMENFGKLVADVYDVAYRRAAADYQEQGEKAGFNVRVVQKPSSDQD